MSKEATMTSTVFRPWSDAPRQRPAKSVSGPVTYEAGATTSLELAVQDVQRGEPIQSARRQNQEETPRSAFSLYGRPEDRLRMEHASHHRRLPVSQPATCNWSPQAVHIQPLAYTPQPVYVVDPWNGPLVAYSQPPTFVPGWQWSTVAASPQNLHVQPAVAYGLTPGAVLYPLHLRPDVNYADVHRSVAGAAGRFEPINQRHPEAATGSPIAAVCKKEYDVSQAQMEPAVPEYEMAQPLCTSTPKKTRGRPSTKKRKTKKTPAAKKKTPAEKKKTPAEKEKTPSEKKKHPCPICGNTFYNRCQVRSHVRVHTGEKPFHCPYAGCPKSFARNEERTRHIRTHTNERPHECSFCRKRFGRRDHLNKHKRSVHRNLV